MPIKIKCPNPSCGKVLNAPDSLAGKNANCPSCKTTVSVPVASAAAATNAAAPARVPAPAAPGAVAPRPAKPAPPAPRVKGPAVQPPSATTAAAKDTAAEDAERLVAELLSDGPPGAVTPTDFIEFVCQWCDEKVKVDIALGGKQTPCPNPECKRITKVPMPADPSKVAWRNTVNKPAGAKVDVEAPEGAWDAKRGLASAESLEAAGALPDRRPPTSTRTWIARGMVAAAVLVFLIGGTVFTMSLLGGKKQAAALKKAMAAVSGKAPTLGGAEAGIVHLKAGQYHLGRKEPHSAKPDKGDAGSLLQLGMAREKLRGDEKRKAESDALLIDLALLQLDLAGSGKDVEDRMRLSWRDTIQETVKTLQAIHQPDRKPPEARSEGVRLVARKLLKLQEMALAENVARQMNDGAVSLGVVGLELYRAGHSEAAAKLLAQALSFINAPVPFNPQVEKTPPPRQTRVTVDLVALAHVLSKEKDLPKPVSDETETIEVGKAIAAAFRSAEEARQLALKQKLAVVRLETLGALADALTDESEAKTTLAAAVNLATTEAAGQPLSPWVLSRLVRLGVSLGMEDGLLRSAVALLREGEPLRGWVQLQLFRERLNRASGKVEDSAADAVDAGTLSHRLALVELVRHNTARDRDAARVVENWDGALKPYGYIGAVLGLQGTK